MAGRVVNGVLFQLVWIACVWGVIIPGLVALAERLRAPERAQTPEVALATGD